MWTALRDLFTALTPRGRFWLAVILILAIFVTTTVTGVDIAPVWALLGG